MLNMLIKDKNSKSSGFTLIELMVAVSIFATVAVIATGAVITANNINQKAQAIKQAMDNLNFALDSMTLKLKSGGGYYCAAAGDFADPPISPNYPSADSQDCTSNPGTAIAFKLADDPGPSNPRRFIYRLRTVAGKGQLQVAKGPDSGSMSSFTPITNDQLDVKSLKFYVVGNNATDLQPRVLISLYGTATVGHQTSDFAIQTTVSDRR